MRFQTFVTLASILASAVADAPEATSHFNPAVEKYISAEGPVALTGLWANIGPNGSKDEGALAGVVVAAPSTDPDYR